MSELRPCHGCGAYLQQHGWTWETVPMNERLDRQHRRKDCPYRKGSTTHRDYVAKGLDSLHVYIDAELVRRAKAAAKETSAGAVVAEALTNHLDGNTVRLPDDLALAARFVAAGCEVDVARLLEVAVADLLALPKEDLRRKLTAK